jgi:hypothetical protein
MTIFIPGKVNRKRRHAAMQTALYHARENRKDRADPNTYAPSSASPGHHWEFAYADNGDHVISDGKFSVVLVSN